MPNRTMFVVLAMILCAAFAQGTDFGVVGNPIGNPVGSPLALDVSVTVSRPSTNEPPGVVPVQITLIDFGDVAGVVPRLDVTIQPSGYSDSKTDISVAPGLPTPVALKIWTTPASGQETCKAWITDSADVNHSNDTAIVLVHVGNPGLSGDVGMPASGSANLLTSNIAHARCGVNHVGPAKVTLYDIRGRVAARYSLKANDSSLDLRSLSTGVYLVRLDDGQRSLTQKLVVQR